MMHKAAVIKPTANEPLSGPVVPSYVYFDLGATGTELDSLAPGTAVESQTQEAHVVVQSEQEDPVRHASQGA